MYNYRLSIKEDVTEFILDSDFSLILEDGIETKAQTIYDSIYDDAFMDDSVTGNASGSYYCNAFRAKEALAGNEYLYEEAVEEFCLDAETVAKNVFCYEYMDVTIRCYLLPEILEEISEYIEDSLNSYADGMFYFKETLNDYLKNRLKSEYITEDEED